MTPFIHELPDWPELSWDAKTLERPLSEARLKQGLLIGQMRGFGVHVRKETTLRTLTEDVVKTSDIEGEKLDAAQVRSSIARRLGVALDGSKPTDRQVDGVVEMVLDATMRYDQPLTEQRLFDWHAALFPMPRNRFDPIIVGAWRNDRLGPMQVVSGPAGHERVHYEAPAASRLAEEMRKFLDWFNDDDTTEAVLKAAQAHFWFVMIHPFVDGNGRIARAIADMALARSEASPERYYSMSGQIRRERSDYYSVLQTTQTTDITPWMTWFLGCLTRAIETADTTLGSVITTSRVWERLRDVSLNDRQRLVINRLLDGFEGKLTSTKWAVLAKCSHDTALRDILQLVERGILTRNPEGGRSTSYSLVTSVTS